MTPNHPPAQVMTTFFQGKGVIGIEATNLTVAEMNRFQSYLPKSRLQPTQDTVETLRLNKDPVEIKAITKACRITAATMQWAINLLRHDHTGSGLKRQLQDSPGVNPLTERTLARLIDRHLIDLGADGLAFPTIVAFGSHTALPHHQPTTTKLTPNKVVLFDFGCQVNGYTADMTRTIFLGTPPPRFKNIESIVLSAYQTALKTLQSSYEVKVLTQRGQKANSQQPKAGPVTAASVDQAARQVITQAGYDKYFIHTTGHGLGLDIHESPSLNPNNQTELTPGMVLTLEPGIYLKGNFGYRHENTILIDR